MTRICAWCPDAPVKTKAAVARGETVSHGLCPTCEAQLNAQLDAREK